MQRVLFFAKYSALRCYSRTLFCFFNNAGALSKKQRSVIEKRRSVFKEHPEDNESPQREQQKGLAVFVKQIERSVEPKERYAKGRERYRITRERGFFCEK